MIPRGLPGEGNLLVFDNGGFAGYGAPNPGSPTGLNNAQRDYSRVIEFDPLTLEKIWEYTFFEAGHLNRMGRYHFYSPLISSAQRLPNGNTMITDGGNGRMLEVTPDFELVWEYMSPYFAEDGKSNYVYRGYRLPYDWVPQVDQPKEIAVPKVDRSVFRVPGTEYEPEERITKVPDATGFITLPQLCVVDTDD
jgi:hypothetical protein